MINPIKSMDKAFSLEGKNAIVTGGNAGIGLAIAKAYAESGANVAILCRDMTKAEAALGELKKFGGKYESFACDLRKPEDVRRAVAEVYASFKSIDILVNNAGISAIKELLEMDEDLPEWYDVMDTNLNGLVHMTYEVGKRMRDAGKGGSMINVSSNAAQVVHRGMTMPHYYASKAALDHFSRYMATELGKYDIRVNVIAPGFTHTDLAKHLPPGKFEVICGLTPLQRWGDPIEVGALAVYFASPASAQVTGSTLVIDGGIMLAVQ